MSDTTNSKITAKKRVIRIQYEELSAKYAAQFVIDRTDEAFLLGFSTGINKDAATGAGVLPVYSRIALSEAGVKRLIKVLQDALSQKGAAERSSARVPLIDGTDG